MNKHYLFLVGIHETHVDKAIQKAKSLGIYVIIGDSEKSIEKNKSLIKNADEIVVVDFEKFQDLLEVSRNLYQENRLNSIFSYKENALYNVARVQEALGLYGNSVEVVSRCKDKYRTKQILSKSGLPFKKFDLCSDENDIYKFIKSYKLPIVIKPRDQKGSIGVVKIDNEKQIRESFNIVLQHNKNNKTILIEEYISGKEISIEAIVYKSEVYIWGITEKLKFPGTFVESGHITPYKGAGINESFLKNITKKIVDALEISMGPLHIEGFITDMNFVVGEVHTRYGGDNITSITELSKQCDLHTPIFAELANLDYAISINQPVCYSAIQYFYAAPGLLKKINGLDEIREIENLIDIKINCNIGDEIKSLTNSYDRVGWFIVSGESRTAVMNTIKAVIEKVEFITTNYQKLID